jgi:catechol 2,3-dioxygenase-like lactoylglutathione lyase family enzyme
MNLRMPYHAGIVVADLALAVDHLTEKMGYTFNEPTTVPVHEVEDRVSGVTGPLEMLVTYSKDGPFRLEVIQAQGAGIYAEPGQGLHHLGIWEPDPEARLRDLEARGEQVDGVFRQRDGGISVIYASPDTPAGTRIEYVGEAQRERLERWFTTGVLS